MSAVVIDLASVEDQRDVVHRAVEALADGHLVVCEYGNNRIQRFSQTGEPLGVAGRVGAGSGELRYPWGVDGADDRLFVLDSGNNRVQVVTPLPWWRW